MVVTKAGRRRTGSECLMGTELQFEKKEFWGWMAVMTAQRAYT